MTPSTAAFEERALEQAPEQEPLAIVCPLCLRLLSTFNNNDGKNKVQCGDDGMSGCTAGGGCLAAPSPSFLLQESFSLQNKLPGGR